MLALSALHAANRFFGVHATLQSTDLALAAALHDPPRAPHNVMNAYADALGDGQTCARHASNAPLGAAEVTLVGDVAVIHPGTGDVVLPAGAHAVAIDLRGLPHVPFDVGDAVNGLPIADPLRAALDAAASTALAAQIQRPIFLLRSWFGMANSDAEWGDVGFEQAIFPVQFESLPAGATADLPLALIVGDTIAPAAAELALALRLSNRAWIFGGDVFTAEAEANFSAVGEEGIVFREFDAMDPNTFLRWPDLVPADAHGSDLGALLHGLSTRGLPPPLELGPDLRPPVAVYDHLYDPQPTTLGPGEGRAGLFIAHGAVRLFYRNFGDVGDFIDDGLHQMLLELEGAIAESGNDPALDRATYLRILRHFGRFLNDGHNFVDDEGRPFTGFLPLKLEQIDGEPVVRRSQIAGITPGDTIVGIDGMPQAEWYARELAITSASTDRYRWNQATRKRLLRVYGPREFDVRSAAGAISHVTATPMPFAYEVTFGSSPVSRGNGFLADLGAPNVFFLNVSYEISPDPDTAVAAIAGATNAEAVIVDMRGYPHGNHYLVDAAFNPEPFFSPDFVEGFVVAPNPTDTLIIPGSFPVDFGTPPLYTGPVILLLGTDTVSAAENFSTMLVDANRPIHVVGRQSAGTNGTITGLELPGHYRFDFTGENVRHADGSQFIGIGLAPDISVIATREALASGLDPELAAALHALGH
jgi:hypothetical protein